MVHENLVLSTELIIMQIGRHTKIKKADVFVLQIKRSGLVVSGGTKPA